MNCAYARLVFQVPHSCMAAQSEIDHYRKSEDYCLANVIRSKTKLLAGKFDSDLSILHHSLKKHLKCFLLHDVKVAETAELVHADTPTKWNNKNDDEFNEGPCSGDQEEDTFKNSKKKYSLKTENATVTHYKTNKRK